MGNFSRDTFDPLKRYVSVRLQQGVPLIDADWNEMDDIRRTELRTFIKWFIGDGIPAKSDGSRNDAFRIAAMSTPDSANFRILADGNEGSGANRCLVDGVEVFITQDIEFTSQPLHENYTGPTPPVDPDATPVDSNAAKIAGIPTTAGSYLVYLDVWEWEVGASEDNAHLVNPSLGVETCVRLKRSWAVRVFKTGEEIRLPNHSYYRLATIDLPTDGAAITPEQITDRRRTEINLSKLKSPIYVERGSIVVDNRALATLFTQLPNVLRSPSLFNVGINYNADFKLQFAFYNVLQVCTAGTMQASTNNINAIDVSQVMLIMAEAQEIFLAKLIRYRTSTANNINIQRLNSFIAEYRRRLGLLRNELADSNLINAYLTQQGIHDWVSSGGSEGARFLSDNWNQLLSNGVRSMTQKITYLTQPGYLLSTEQGEATFKEDRTIQFRNPLIQSLEQNSTTPLDEEVIMDLDESFQGAEVNQNAYREMFKSIKKEIEASTNLSQSAKEQSSSLIDYIINALS